jgi:raffinose/stachyose/melibiose transport system permease protein
MAAKKVTKAEAQVSTVRRSKHSGVLSVVMLILSLLWIYPLFVVLLNSFKRKAYIFKNPFGLSKTPISKGFAQWKAGISKTFVGWLNYANAIKKTDFFHTFGYSLFITVVSVALIILCCSMTAWFIVRVKDFGSNLIYVLCMFSMIVPFQMVMFTLSKLANMLKLSNPVGICIVYLGFGAGLAVFMFTGFVKSIPLEIEEAAMIDGCTPDPDLLPGHRPDHEADTDHRRDPRCDVDLERLPAPCSCSERQQVQDYPDRGPVPEAEPRPGRLGRHDGSSGSRHRPDRHLLHFLPEVHH